MSAIIDETTIPAPVQVDAPAPAVDPSLIADLVMGRLFQAQQAGQPAPAQKDLANDIIKELTAGNFDPGFIEGIAKSVSQIDKTIDARLQTAVVQYSEKQKNDRANDIIRDTIAIYGEADDLIKEYGEAVFQKVVDRFNSDPSMATARHKFGQGIVDRTVFAQLAKDEVIKFYKKAGKDAPAKTGPAMKPAASSGAASTPEAMPTESELSGHALSVFQSHQQLAIRSGKKPEEAKAMALKQAKRFM